MIPGSTLTNPEFVIINPPNRFCTAIRRRGVLANFDPRINFAPQIKYFASAGFLHAYFVCVSLLARFAPQKKFKAENNEKSMHLIGFFFCHRNRVQIWLWTRLWMWLWIWKGGGLGVVQKVQANWGGLGCKSGLGGGGLLFRTTG